MNFCMKKTIKHNAHALLILLFLISIPLLLCTACSMHVTKEDKVLLEQLPTEDYQQTQIQHDSSTDTFVETTEALGEWNGKYLLSDIQQDSGIYIKYDDMSFDKYLGVSYEKNSDGFWNRDLDGLFLNNSIADKLPIVDNQVNLVVRWDDYFQLELHPVSSEASVISMDSVNGYGKLDSDKKMVTAFCRNGSFVRFFLATINGKPAEDYPAKIEERTVNPYAGARSRSLIVKTTSFEKDSLVTLGIKEGSSLIEEQFYADATFYDFNSEHKSWDIPYEYLVKYTPTVDGYADLDFSDIPNGKYVLVLYGVKNNIVTYIATVITLDK